MIGIFNGNNVNISDGVLKTYFEIILNKKNINKINEIIMSNQLFKLK